MKKKAKGKRKKIKIWGNLREYFVEGLILLFPFVVAILILIFLVHFFIFPFLHFFLPYPHFVIKVLSFAISLVFITGCGFIGKKWLSKSLRNWGHHLILKIPFIRSVYKSSYEVVKTLLNSEKKGLSTVVLFPYGTSGGLVIGIVPRTDNVFEKHTPIIHPGTPSPLHGMILFLPEGKIVETPLSVEEAIRFSLSLGSATLEDLKK